MTTRTLVFLAAGLEAATGVLLVANPGFVVHLLIGASLSGGGAAVGRVCGLGLLSLGMSAWPSGKIVSAQATWCLFTYNLLSALYIGYLGARGGFAGYLLWPACFLHGLTALLLTGHVYGTVRRKWLENYQ